MNKSILWLIGLLFAASCTIVSCSETDGVEDPYINWEERNQKYIDSIAVVAKANMGDEPGQWKIIRSYKLGPLEMGGQDDVNDYVYCKIMETGDGGTPLFTDTVTVNYRGQLINGTVFDQSYKGELNPDISTVSKFTVSQVVVGWTTALMNMRVGDRWMLYIPSDLGYGASAASTIPAYSTLIFDLHLAGLFPLKGTGKAVQVPLNE